MDVVWVEVAGGVVGVVGVVGMLCCVASVDSSVTNSFSSMTAARAKNKTTHNN